MTAIHRAEGRVVLDAQLGCHVCGARFPLEAGVAAFGTRARREAPSAAAPPDHWRLAALLGLSAPSGVVVLEGSTAAAAGALLEMLPATILAVNPSASLPPRERFGAVSTGFGLPLRTGVAAAIALRDRSLLAAAAQVLRPGGRLVAPADWELPTGLEELARDELEWVAEKRGGGEPIQLSRR